MMKVCIVTVYNSENCGSYMQAYALGIAIARMGHSVVYYKRKRHITPPNQYYLSRQIAKMCLKGQWKDAALRLKDYIAYVHAENSFEVITEQSKAYQEQQCFVIGSDTLWNLDSDHFLDEKDLFWGVRFNGRGMITYAVSVSNTKKEKINALIPVKEALARFNRVSVRDMYTKYVIGSLCDKEIDIVCDPTLLLNAEDYSELTVKQIKDRFILLYCFVDIFLTPDFREQIVNIAKKKGLRIISYGTSRDWCDQSVPYDPATFAAYIKQADFVITNTFHGTMFSMIFERQFVAVAEEKNKVREALQMHGLEDRLIGQNADLERISQMTIDYAPVRAIIQSEREKGLDYLRNALNEVENASKL